MERQRTEAVNLYSILQVAVVVGNLHKYLVTQEVKSYLSEVKQPLLCSAECKRRDTVS